MLTAELTGVSGTSSTNGRLDCLQFGLGLLDPPFAELRLEIDKAELQKRLEEAMLLIGERDYAGVRWLSALSENLWAPGEGYTWFDLYQPLTRFLYSLGFLCCTGTSGSRAIVYLDDPLYLDSESNFEKCPCFLVHSAYQRALDIFPDGNRHVGKRHTEGRTVCPEEPVDAGRGD